MRPHASCSPKLDAPPNSIPAPAFTLATDRRAPLPSPFPAPPASPRVVIMPPTSTRTLSWRTASVRPWALILPRVPSTARTSTSTPSCSAAAGATCASPKTRAKTAARAPTIRTEATRAAAPPVSRGITASCPRAPTWFPTSRAPSRTISTHAHVSRRHHLSHHLCRAPRRPPMHLISCFRQATRRRRQLSSKLS